MGRGTRICGLLAILLSATLATPRPAAGAGPPNVVLILADDLGYGDLGCYGCRDIKTPNIDRLASQGVRFTNFYANGPECTPTRAALLTGRYQHRVGGLECAIGNGNVGRYDDAARLRETNDLGLPVGETALPRLLKGAGYTTAVCGKWHLGYEDKFAPNLHGFDHAFYALGGGMDYFHHVEGAAPSPTVLRLNAEPIQRPGYFTDLVAEDAVRFIRESKGKSFFLYVPFTAPHAPFQGPDDDRPEPLPEDSPLWKQGQAPPRVYAAMIERLDAAVGTILGALETLTPGADTLVIFTSDNGGTASARPTPFSGLKGGTFEGGIRVPCIIRRPGVVPANTVTDRVAITMDLTASIARVAGARPPGDRPFDGIDVFDHLGDRQPVPERTLFWRARRGDQTWWAVREGSLKYVARQDGPRKTESLFDLRIDPGENDNLLDRRGEDSARLKVLLAAWEREVRPTR
jgi:arylsulfatase A-like enzyme